MSFNEDFRIKLPAIQYLMKLGYLYFHLLNKRTEDTNIFEAIFVEAWHK
jgi:hypothetical protein